MTETGKVTNGKEIMAARAIEKFATTSLERYRLNPNLEDLISTITDLIKALLMYPSDQTEHIRNCKEKLSSLVREGLTDSGKYGFVFPGSWDIEVVSEGRFDAFCERYGHTEEYLTMNNENIPNGISLVRSFCGLCGREIIYVVLNEV